MPIDKVDNRAGRGVVAVGLAAGLLLAACGGGAGKGATAGGGTSGAAGALPAAELALVAYSTPQNAYDAITEAFRKTPQGRNITFTRSYGASGDQSRAVVAGLNADIVAFSLAPDMTRLVAAGMVADDWAADEHDGMVTDSVVALVTRKSNPKKINGWADLTRPGVQVITPNPFTSGGARWNVMAAYGQVTRGGGTDDAAVSYLNDLFKNVPVQDDSARKALQTFTSGKGDAMVAYENEAIFAQAHGQAIDYVVPDSTILIENPVAATRTTKYPEQAKAFLDYLRTPAAQEIFAANGYRPVVAGVKTSTRFPAPKGLFTIADLGGWSDVTKRFFDANTGVMADVERRIGVTVGK